MHVLQMATKDWVTHSGDTWKKRFKHIVPTEQSTCMQNGTYLTCVYIITVIESSTLRSDKYLQWQHTQNYQFLFFSSVIQPLCKSEGCFASHGERQTETERERERGLNSACFIVLVKMYNDDTIKLIVSKTWTKHALFWCLFTMTAQQLVISEASTNPFPTFANKHRLLSSFSHKMNNVHSKNDRHRWQPKSDNHPGMLFSLQLFSTSRRLHSITTWSWTGLSEVSKLCKLSFV